MEFQKERGFACKTAEGTFAFRKNILSAMSISGFQLVLNKTKTLPKTLGDAFAGHAGKTRTFCSNVRVGQCGSFSTMARGF